MKVLDQWATFKECLEISDIPESISGNALQDIIQGVLREIDVEVDIENIESCHRLKGRFTLKEGSS